MYNFYIKLPQLFCAIFIAARIVRCKATVRRNSRVWSTHTAYCIQHTHNVIIDYEYIYTSHLSHATVDSNLTFDTVWVCACDQLTLLCSKFQIRNNRHDNEIWWDICVSCVWHLNCVSIKKLSTLPVSLSASIDTERKKKKRERKLWRHSNFISPTNSKHVLIECAKKYFQNERDSKGNSFIILIIQLSSSLRIRVQNYHLNSSAAIILAKLNWIRFPYSIVFVNNFDSHESKFKKLLLFSGLFLLVFSFLMVELYIFQ